jgi:dienelactone hydrolase
MIRVTRLGAVLTAALWLGSAAHAQPVAAEASPWKPMAYDAPGPEAVVGSAGGPRCTIFRPRALGQSPHAVVLWGNGTGTQPVNYKEILQTLASWGFVVAAANTPNAGTGADMLACLDWLTAENGREGSVYQGRLDLTKVGATGHSQGGGGALMAGRDPRIKAVAPLQPAVAGPRFAADALSQQKGPILLLSGGADVLARPEVQQQPVFENANQPVVWATLAGASHMIPLHGGATYSGIITAWFRWRLMGDAKAGALFRGERCGYCVSPDWTVQRKGAL